MKARILLCHIRPSRYLHIHETMTSLAGYELLGKYKSVYDKVTLTNQTEIQTQHKQFRSHDLSCGPCIRVRWQFNRFY